MDGRNMLSELDLKNAQQNYRHGRFESSSIAQRTTSTF